TKAGPPPHIAPCPATLALPRAGEAPPAEALRQERLHAPGGMNAGAKRSKGAEALTGFPGVRLDRGQNLVLACLVPTRSPDPLPPRQLAAHAAAKSGWQSRR